MSGFDPKWLALREPADCAARSSKLAQAAGDWLGLQDRFPHVLDIGCGTGSTWRSLSPYLPAEARWTLLDNDEQLLAAARRQIGSPATVRFCHQDLKDLPGLPVEGASLLSASALFDLCSDGFCQALVDRISPLGCGIYAALTYDGLMRWSLAHPLDEAVVASFNRHQQTDKGLGPALGPQAPERLAALLDAAGFSVATAASPWRLGPGQIELQKAFLLGFRKPLEEMKALSRQDIDDWLSFRLLAVTRADSHCEVGHQDILALPPLCL